MTTPGKKTALIADHSSEMAGNLKRIVSDMGLDVFVCTDADEILPGICKNIPDILIIDEYFSGNTEVLNAIGHILDEHDIPVIIISGYSDENLITNTRVISPYAFLVKPINEYEFKSNITAAILRNEKKLKFKESMLDEIRRREIFGNLSGESNAIRDVLLNAAVILNRNINVLITGESGTGKELLARALHKGSPRKGPFVAINCAAISTELSDSLLFGHSKGSFTGAINDQAGYFEQSNGGTIFLDEIGDMKPDVQAKVLRVIEDKKIRRVGEKAERNIDMRIISATNRDLKEAVAASEFRRDLYYRLEEYHIHIPPLRERMEDIPVLSEHILESLCVFYELEPMEISSSAMKDLMQYSWPGNIRELKNVIQRSAIRNNDRIINIIDMPGVQKENIKEKEISSRGQSENSEVAETLREIESRVIRQTLERTNGNIAKAAVMLDIGRATLYRKIDKLGIKLN